MSMKTENDGRCRVPGTFFDAKKRIWNSIVVQ